MSAITNKKVLLLLLLLLYAGIYGTIIGQGNGLPYITENFESFSVHWEARNLFLYGITDSCGLTDEACSPFPGAHPYVHTHQGNFPRLFGWLLYAIGIRTTAGQIIACAFTVGVLVLVLAFSFFSRLVSPLFAFVACGLLLTDYLMFAQWNVNTYRVWWGVYFFLAFRCLQGMRDTGPGDWVSHTELPAGAKRKPLITSMGWRLLAALGFACMFYNELIFAFFVTVGMSLYGLFLFRGRWGLWFRSLLWPAAGAVLGLGMLLVQLACYYGPANILKDARLVYQARNYYSPRAQEELDAFYRKYFVIENETNFDGRAFCSISSFLRLTFTNHFAACTPFFALCGLIVLWGAMLSRWGPPCDKLGGRNPFVPRISPPWAMCLVWGFLVLACYLFLTALYADGVYSCREVGKRRFPLWPGKENLGPVLALSLILPAIFAVAGRKHFPAWPRLILVGIFFLGSSLFLRAQGFLYEGNWIDFWKLRRLEAGWLHWPGRFWVILAVLLGGIFIVRGLPRTIGPGPAKYLGRLPAFLIAGLIAFALTFFLSPGYVVFGYLLRGSLFAIFFTSALLATAIFLLGCTAWRMLRKYRAAGGLKFSRAGLGLAAGLQLFGLLVYWGFLQWDYNRTFPPTGANYLTLLRSPAFREATFATGSYPVPLMLATGNWAYFIHPDAMAAVIKSGADFGQPRAQRSLCVRDYRDQKYRRPDYLFLAYYHHPQFHIQKLKGIDVLKNDPVLTWIEGEGRSQGHQVVARDPNGRWVVIHLNWDEKRTADP